MTNDMISDKKVLAIIPARGGSKGVPQKNIRLLGGKPLIAWTIEAVGSSQFIDRVVVSTDDDVIAKVAKSYGADVPFMRPEALAGDSVPGTKVVIHALGELPEYDYVVLLQPTSPFRTSDDVDVCIKRCHEARTTSCVSVTEIDKSPFWMFKMADDRTITPLFSSKYLKGKQRQDLPRTVVLNGAVFVARVPDFMRWKTFFFADTVGYEMPRERSLDIDTVQDFEMAELYLLRTLDITL